MTNPSVVILSNWSPERVYSKAILKDPTALDSLLVRLQVVELTEPLDIDGFREALAQASPATTVTPTTSVVAEDSSVTISPREEELEASNSTIDLSPLNSPLMESPTSTPPLQRHSVQSLTMTKEYEINEDELIPCKEVQVQREETSYEKFMRERREKVRKQQQEEDKISAIDKIAFKGKSILFTGYN